MSENAYGKVFGRLQSGGASYWYASDSEYEWMLWDGLKHPEWWRIMNIVESNETARLWEDEGRKCYVAESAVIYRARFKMRAYSDVCDTLDEALSQSRQRVICRYLLSIGKITDEQCKVGMVTPCNVYVLRNPDGTYLRR